MNIYIGFSKPRKKKLVSELIMLFQETEFSHAYIRFPSKTLQRDVIYEATGHGVNFISPKLFAAKNQIVKEFEFAISEEDKNNAMRFCIDHAGLSYGFMTLVGLAIYTKTGIKNCLVDQNQTFICSELVGHILKGIFPNIKNDINYLTPKELHSLVESLQNG